MIENKKQVNGLNLTRIGIVEKHRRFKNSLFWYIKEDEAFEFIQQKDFQVRLVGSIIIPL